MHCRATGELQQVLQNCYNKHKEENLVVLKLYSFPVHFTCNPVVRDKSGYIPDLKAADANAIQLPVVL